MELKPKMKMAVVKFFNPSLEEFKCQHNNAVYRFKPREVTTVPEAEAYEVWSQWKHRGIFPFEEGEDFKSLEKEGLIRYRDQKLKVQLQRIHAHHDDLKKAGVTIEDDADISRIEKWIEEITRITKSMGEVQEAPSFLDLKEDKVVKKTSVTGKKVVGKKSKSYMDKVEGPVTFEVSS